MDSKLVKDIKTIIVSIPSMFVGLLNELLYIIKNIRNGNDFVLHLKKGLKNIDLGGEEVYWMFVGGMLFIFITHILNVLNIQYYINKILPLFIFNWIITKLTQLTLFIVFIWFILAFIPFIWVLFFQKNALNNKQSSDIKNNDYNNKTK